jgi:hypothetical protein
MMNRYRRGKIGPSAALIAAMVAIVLLAACGSGSGGGTKPPVVGGITVYPGSATISQNATAQFTAYSGPAIVSATWSVLSGTGTISSSGLFTAPGTSETDTIQAVSGSNASPAITINVLATQPVAVTPAAVAVPAGASQQFTTAAGCASTTWSVTASALANPGTVTNGATSCGLYTAPLSPPRGGTVTITAMSGGSSGTSTVTILFSNASLNSLVNPGNPQPYAIAYSGHSGAAFFSIAGSFIADGSGNITSGTEDVNSGASGGSANTPIQASTYTVGPDGRTTANITTAMGTGVVWQFALISNQHALMIRLDGNATGSGTIDQQNPIDFNSPFPLGNYAFGLSGMDAHSHATGVAGTLFANGNDTFPLGNGVLDLNDPGSSSNPANVTDDNVQGGFVSADSATGRGTLTLGCPSFDSTFGTDAVGSGTLTFVFYIVDATHVKVVEADSLALLSGDFYSAPAVTANMTGTQAFFVSGSDTGGHPYGMGGAFVSTSTGVLDLNDNGSLTSPTTNNGVETPNVTSATPSLDTTTGRIDLTLSLNNSSSQFEFAAYLFNYTAANGLQSSGAVLLEIDTRVGVGTGRSYTQTSSTTTQGSFALGLAGVQLAGGGPQDMEGQFSTESSGAVSGTVDINTNGSLVAGESLTAGSSIATVGLNGRGNPLTLAGKVETNKLSYFVIDGNTGLLVEMDGNQVLTGTMALQF